MTIYYCLVANKNCPLAEYSNGGDKKMVEVAQKLLKKLSFDEASVESVACEGKTYSYRVEDEVVYVCVTNEAFGKRCVRASNRCKNDARTNTHVLSAHMHEHTLVNACSSAALFLKHINQLFDNEFGIRGKATKLKLDLNRDFAPTLKKQMVRPVCV